MRQITTIATLLAALTTTSAAGADVAKKQTIVLAPLATLGSETRSKTTAKIRAPLLSGLASVPGVVMVSDRAVEKQLRKSKRARLRTCDGDAVCLAELGQLLAADAVVYGELGGLGDAQIVYLKVVDTAAAKEVRSTSLELGAIAPTEAKSRSRAAAFRLLAPEAYVGRLIIATDTEAASIYVDGTLVGKSPSRPISLPVGTHALRVTHNEFRDFVRFVNIEFDTDYPVSANLARYKVVSSDIKLLPGDKTGDGGVIYRGTEPTPWYRKWHVVAGFSAATLLTSALVIGIIANGIDADRETTVGD
jgi:hypothetical protein